MFTAIEDTSEEEKVPSSSYRMVASFEEAKKLLESEPVGSFCICPRNMGASGHLIVIVGFDSQTHRYPVVHTVNGKVVFGERYSFENIETMMAKLHLEGIPTSCGKRLYPVTPMGK